MTENIRASFGAETSKFFYSTFTIFQTSIHAYLDWCKVPFFKTDDSKLRIWRIVYSNKSSSSSSRHPLSGISSFLIYFKAFSSSQNVWNFAPYSPAPSTSPFAVPFSHDIHTIDVSWTDIGKHLPSLVNGTWLLRISRGCWSQSQKEKYFERIIMYSSSVALFLI